ncbi:MAG: MarR family winged helix-turn-helix transcriptional regulator [Anaerolineae bacterium]
METETASLEKQAHAVMTVLFDLIRQGSKRFSEQLLKYDMTIVQYSALSALDRAQGACTMTELAEDIQQSSATMTGVIDRLVDKGWVTRERSEEDRRTVYVRITDQGLEMLRAVNAEQYQEFIRILSRMSPDNRQALLHHLTEYMQLAGFYEPASVPAL